MQIFVVLQDLLNTEFEAVDNGIKEFESYNVRFTSGFESTEPHII